MGTARLQGHIPDRLAASHGPQPRHAEVPLNARMAPHGYVIHARKGQDANHLVMRTGEGERVEQFGLFEIRRMSSAFPSAMHS